MQIDSNIDNFMQIVSSGDSLPEMSNPVFCEKNKINNNNNNKDEKLSICLLLNLSREW